MKNDRGHYRKNLSLTAYLIGENEEEKAFRVRNLSLSGMKAHFDSPHQLAADQAVRVKLPELDLEGYMFPVWKNPAPEGGLDVGFEFSSLEGVKGNRYLFRDDHRHVAS
jgi:hypothetical protein